MNKLFIAFLVMANTSLAQSGNQKNDKHKEDLSYSDRIPLGDGQYISQADFDTMLALRLHNLRSLMKSLILYKKQADIDYFGMRLFNYDEKVLVQVKNAGQPVRTWHIREYFRRLCSLPYTSVDIQDWDIQFVTNLKKGSGNTYLGTCTVLQHFRGSTPELSYKDDTRKHVTIVVIFRTDQIEGNLKFNVFLSDIYVVDK